MLTRERKWLASCKPTAASTERKKRLVETSVSILRRSWRDYSGWVRRKDRARLLSHKNRRWTTQAAIRELGRLVDLAISDLELHKAQWAAGIYCTQFPDQKKVDTSAGLAKARAAKKAKSLARKRAPEERLEMVS